MVTANNTSLRWLPLVALFVLGTLWGANAVFSKGAALGGITPLGAVFWQSLWAGLLLSAVCAVRRQPIRLDRKHLAYYAFVGSFTITMSYVALVYVSGRISAAYGSVIVIFGPVLTYVFAMLVGLERFRLLRGFGIALGFAGAGLLVFSKGALPSPELIPVALIGLLVPTGYALSNIYVQWGRPEAADNMALAAGTMYAVALATGVIGLLDGGSHAFWANVTGASILLGYGTSTAVAFILYFWIVAMAGAVYLSQVGFISTLTGIGWGMAIFGEQPPLGLWIAVAIVFAGVLLVNLGKPGP
jgi:drug/metabolite transporter (DMT)-like permease